MWVEGGRDGDVVLMGREHFGLVWTCTCVAFESSLGGLALRGLAHREVPQRQEHPRKARDRHCAFHRPIFCRHFEARSTSIVLQSSDVYLLCCSAIVVTHNQQ